MKRKIIIIPIVLIIFILIISFIFINKLNNNTIYEDSSTSSNIAIMLEQDDGTYKESTSSSWPSSGYVFNDILSKCDNGGSITWDSDNKSITYDIDNTDMCYIYFDVYVPTIGETCQGKNFATCLSENYTLDTSIAADDPDDNPRYIGGNPDNYVSFNDELWRIIGVFDVASEENGTTEKRIKLIRSDALTNANGGTGFSWDYKQSGVGSSTKSGGSNDWSDSQLMMYLNSSTGYNLKSSSYTRTTDGLVKYNDYIVYQEGCEPASVTTSTTAYSCTSNSFTLISSAQSMIDDAVWNLGGTNDAGDTSNGLVSHWYTYERGTTVYDSSRPTTWVGKVGLFYPSDYGYATDGGGADGRISCLNSFALRNWGEHQDCYSSDNNWLYDDDNSQWSITANPGSPVRVEIIMDGGEVLASTSGLSYWELEPVVFLSSSVSLSGGDGTSTNPFKLKID